MRVVHGVPEFPALPGRAPLPLNFGSEPVRVNATQRPARRPAEIQRLGHVVLGTTRFRAALDSFDGYVGVNNHMGSRFTADRASMAPVLAELHRRGLLWLDSRTTPNSAGIGLAQELKMPWVGRDVFLDNEETVAAVKAQLAKTEQVAKRQGYAVAIGHPHDATIEALASWLPDVQKRGFVLVPVHIDGLCDYCSTLCPIV